MVNTVSLIRAEDLEEYRRFCLHHARHFGRPLPAELWHYTDTNGLIGILQSGTIWGTHVTCLNDTLEQRYFGDLVHAAVKERRKQNADPVLEPLFRVADEALDQRDFTATGQFVACFSEIEDDLGQWRGYGGGECGFAIGFHAQQLLGIVERRPGTLLLPMGYADGIHSFVVADVIKWAEIYYRKGLDRGDPVQWATEFVGAFASELNLIAATVKHPKFALEAERRIATVLQQGEHANLIFRPKRTMLARHLPLKLIAADTRRLPISRIFVGPGAAQRTSRIAVGDLLLQCGYPSGEVKIELSAVPYRVP